MTNYALASVPPIHGGAGARAGLTQLARRHARGRPILFAADPGLGASGAIDDVRALLAASGSDVVVYSDFASDPAVSATDEGARLAREGDVGAVVGLGGGSALDLGKVVAAIAGTNSSAQDYELGKRDFPAERLPFIAVSTTAGTGSELTRTSVLTRADKAKIWLWGDALRSAEVVLDPELTVTLPRALTIATALDALVHATEAATNRNASAANNVFAHEAIRLVARHAGEAAADGSNLAARDALQRAAALAGIAIDNAGTAIAHNIGHALGSLAPIHHGRAVAIAMLATNAWNADGDDGRFAACAAAMGVAATPAGFVEGFERLARGLGLDCALGEGFAAISAETLAERMGRPENASMLSSNWKRPACADIVALAAATLRYR